MKCTVTLTLCVSAARRAGDAQRERAEELAKDAEKSAQKVKKYIANTVSKMKQRELAEEQRQTEHIKQRMSTILSLKRDITLNKVTHVTLTSVHMHCNHPNLDPDLAVCCVCRRT